MSEQRIADFLTSPVRFDNWDPPYDSPIEHDFAWKMAKRVAPNVALRKQVPIPTPWGDFRLDFVVSDGVRSIGIELDGREFHDPIRDRWRDVAVLVASDIAAMYRIPGTTVHHGLEDALFLISRAERRFFGDRERRILETEISDGIRFVREDEDKLRWCPEWIFDEEDQPIHPSSRELWIIGRALSGPCIADKPIARHLAMAATLMRHPGASLDAADQLHVAAMAADRKAHRAEGGSDA